MGDGVLGRETMFYLMKNSLLSQSSDEDAEETAKVSYILTEK